MSRPLLFACLFAALAGCQGRPLRPVQAPEAKPRPTVFLFEEIEPDPNAVKQTVVRHLPPGMSVDLAQDLLEKQGFTCRPYSNWAWFFNRQNLIPPEVSLPLDVQKRLHARRKFGPVFCHATLKGKGEWHLERYPVLVVLVPDEARKLAEVEADIRLTMHSRVKFFNERPDLREPVGLSVEAATARMAAAGFHCSGLQPEGADDDARPHVFCLAFNEGVLGGHIIRVHLYPDEAGVVRETDVRTEEGPFDAEWCMLPHGDETTTWAITKGVLFPVRIVTRYTLIAAAVALVAAAQSGTQVHLHR